MDGGHAIAGRPIDTREHFSHLPAAARGFDHDDARAQRARVRLHRIAPRSPGADGYICARARKTYKSKLS
ncbi:hypothetical protein KGP93_32690 [Burkholderia multivorans]|nr:hypothetical protein [Burkholderia multivorans]